MSGAERLGERLVREVEVEGLSELLSALRDLGTSDAQQRAYFGIPELDVLLLWPASSPTPAAQSGPQPPHYLLPDLTSDDLRELNVNPNQHTSPAPQTAARKPTINTTRPPQRVPILELLSPPTTHSISGSGKTSLIYLIIVLAILPPTISSVSLGGQNAAIVVLDPLSHFSVKRLASICISFMLSQIPSDQQILLKDQLKETVRSALHHVHIFRPPTWATLTETLEQMPGYLFDRTQHQSMGRRVQSIIVEDVDAFYCDVRCSSSTSTSTASTTLTSSLLALSDQLSAAIVLTSHSGAANPSVFRASFPLHTSWPPHVSVTRLAARRVEVLPFAPGISIEEAERERGERWNVVKRGRFECWKVGARGKGEKEGGGFVFRVWDGVEVERGENRR